MTTAIYRAVDHVLIRLLAAQPLYALFSEVFALPVSWPLQRSDVATFGWVHVGNTNLEFWAAANNSDLPSDCQPPLVHGLALDPVDLSASVAKLAESGVLCKTPKPYQTKSEHGVLVTNFTNSTVLDVSSDSCCIFFCAWDKNGTIFPWKETLTVGQRRTKENDAFRQCGGGSLGMVRLSRVELSVPDLAVATEKWRALTGTQSIGPVALTEDLTLDLVSGKRNVIESLTFEVRSLAVARAALEARGLLGDAGPSELMLASDAACGLNFRFIESTSQ